MAKKKIKKTESWQLSVMSLNEGPRKGIVLEVYNPLQGIFKRVVVMGGEVSRNGASTGPLFAKRLAGRFKRKLLAEGLEIPNVEERIVPLVEGKWFG